MTNELFAVHSLLAVTMATNIAPLHSKFKQLCRGFKSADFYQYYLCYKLLLIAALFLLYYISELQQANVHGYFLSLLCLFSSFYEFIFCSAYYLKHIIYNIC